MTTNEQRTQAKELVAQMIAADMSRSEMDNRIDTAEMEARKVADTTRRKELFAVLGEVRRLIAQDRKLGMAGLLPRYNRVPYSQIP